MSRRAVRRWLAAMGLVATLVGFVALIHLLGREAAGWEHTSDVTDPVLADVATWFAFILGCVVAAMSVVGAERYLQLGEALDAAVDENEALRAELAEARAYGLAWETWAAEEADDTEPRGRHLALITGPTDDDPDRTLVDATLTHPVGGR